MSGISFNLNLNGLDRALVWFQAEPDRVRKGTAQGLDASAVAIMGKAQEIVPLDLGPLRASGTVLPPEISGNTISVTLGFGGAAEDYAWRQHEDLTYKHAPGRQAKYLEQPMMEAESSILGRIVDAIQGQG